MTMQKDMMGRAVRDSFAKLDPRVQIQNPVMFLVWLSAVMTSVLAVASIFGVQDAGVPTYYVVAIAVILWLTDLFSNFAEALAEGRGKAQADSLRAAKKDVEAHRIESVEDKEHFTVVPGTELTRGDLVIVRAGEQIPGDGDVIEGAASVDESAITGESAPVVREAGGDRSAVTGGTTVLSDWIIVKISSEPGQSFLDKMIAMVEGAARKKTPNEIALEIFLVALSIVFILVTLALYCYSCFSVGLNDMDNPTAVTTLVALLVCLAPTTIGALLSAIGIAGMSRLNEANVLAMSGRAIEAAGDVDILMLDKTGTIPLGNRQAAEFIPVDGIDPAELADAAQLSSLADETPEGRSIVVLAKEQFGLRGRTLEDKGMEFIPFTAATRMSGVNYEGNEIRKGAADSVRTYVEAAGGVFSQECDEAVERIAYRLTAPGIGLEVGSYAASYQPFYQGLFMAPHTVAQAIKTACLAARVFEILGMTTTPAADEPRADIIQAIQMRTPERLVAFCQGIQMASPIDSMALPEPWDMPGYNDQVVMAAGTFVAGASIELSADAPMREPYTAYMQGGLTYTHGRIALQMALNRMVEQGALTLK